MLFESPPEEGLSLFLGISVCSFNWIRNALKVDFNRNVYLIQGERIYVAEMKVMLKWIWGSILQYPTICHQLCCSSWTIHFCVTHCARNQMKWAPINYPRIRITYSATDFLRPANEHTKCNNRCDDRASSDTAATSDDTHSLKDKLAPTVQWQWVCGKAPELLAELIASAMNNSLGS